MKRSKTLFGALLSALAITAVSCTTEPLNPEQTVQEGLQTRTVTLSAAIADADTKAAIDNAGVFSWKADDAIAVYTSEGRFVKFTLKEGAGEKSAKFEGTLAAEETVGNIAVYPYSEALKLDGNNLTVNLPAQLDYVDGETHSAPMLAKIDGENPSSLSFKHLGGFMRFNVTNVPLGAATCILDAANLQITGNFDVDVTAESPVLAATDNSKNKVFKFNIATPTTTGTKATYLIPVPANTYKGFTLKFADKTGQTLDKQYKTNATENIVTRSGLINMPEWNLKSSLPMPNNLKVVRNEHNAVVFNWDMAKADVEGALINEIEFSTWCDQRYEFFFYEKTSTGSLKQITTLNRAWGHSKSGTTFYKDQCGVGFGNLSPNTTYVFRVRTSTASNAVNRSGYAQVEVKTANKEVEADNVIYSQRFDNIWWGSDIKNFGAGFGPTTTEYLNATGLDDLKTIGNFFWPDKTLENFADNKKIPAATAAEVLEVSSTTGSNGRLTAIQALYPHLGYIKMGTGSTVGIYTTPALTNLTENTTVKLSFSAARYVDWKSGTAQTPEAAVLKVTANGISESFTLTNDWATYEWTINDATSETTIKFETTKIDSSNKRAFLDNIVVTKVTE